MVAIYHTHALVSMAAAQLHLNIEGSFNTDGLDQPMPWQNGPESTKTELGMKPGMKPV